MSKVAVLAENATRSTIESLGYELIEVDYSRQYDQMNLTFYIDSDTGISLDDCEKVHNAIDPILDEADPTGGAPYILNVSSPGIDRPFKTERDYRKNLGKLVEVNLYAAVDGCKKFEGTFLAYDEQTLTIATDDGKELTFDRAKISIIRQTIRF